MTPEIGASEKLVAGETHAAYVRLAVIAIGTGLYFYGDAAAGSLPRAEGVVLALAWIYGAAIAVLQPHRRVAAAPFGWLSTVLDLLFMCVWIGVTGGFESRWYDLYYLGLAACAFRFGLVETAAIGIAYAASYPVTLALLGELHGNEPAVVLRMMNVILMGFTCALLAGETLSQIRARLGLAAAARTAGDAEAKLDGIVRDAPIALLLCDASGRIERRNAPAEALLGEPRMPERLQEVLSRLRDPAKSAALARVFEGGGRVSARVRMPAAGAERDVQIDVSATRERDGALAGVAAAFHDLTVGAAAETERRRARMQAEESERRRISHELQEEVAQILTGVRLALGLVARSPESRGQHIEAAREQVNRLVTRVRHLSRDLRPSVLDDLGLLPALRSLGQRFQERTGLVVDLRVTGLSRRFGTELETAAFRIVQEVLENVVRHSGATSATVAAWTDEASLWLSIDDEGRGFDANTTAWSGLAATRDRAEILGGTFSIDSAPGEGVRVSVSLPIGGSA